MSDRIEAVLAAAYACFARHGVRRTTMEDIAVEAGMSRAAVYQYVRNKNDVFHRLAAALFASALAEAQEAAERPGSVTHRLQAVLSTKLELTLRLWQDSPHASELLDASAKLTGDLVDGYTRDLTAVLTGLLRPDAGARADAVAGLAVAMTRGLETGGTDPDVTRRLLGQGAALLVAGLPATEAH